MYVCVCHAIRCRDVREVADQGSKRASDVFRRFEVKPQCGKCVSSICDMLRDTRSTERATERAEPDLTLAYACAAE